MKKLLLLMMAVALVGCGKKTTPSEPETNAEPKVAKIPANAFINTLGMPFVPVPGTEEQVCIWETRVKDYAAYAAANAGVDGSWKNFGFFGFKTEFYSEVFRENNLQNCESCRCRYT